jgi:hypothetical protein
VHLGHFLSHEVTMPVAVPPGQRQTHVKVIKTEEKGSDVNLATHLMHDAHMGRFDVYGEHWLSCKRRISPRNRAMKPNP